MRELIPLYCPLLQSKYEKSQMLERVETLTLFIQSVKVTVRLENTNWIFRLNYYAYSGDDGDLSQLCMYGDDSSWILWCHGDDGFES